MGTFEIVLLVIGALLLIGIGLCLYFKKDYIAYHSIFTPAISALFTCVKAVSGLIPDNNVIKVLINVLNAAIEATTIAEKLWLDSALDKDKRNDYAQIYIESILQKAGIEITENIKAIINGAISFTCFVLPHGQQPKKENIEEA